MGFTSMPTTLWQTTRRDNQGDAPTAFAGEVNYGLPIADRFQIRRNLGNVEGTRRNRMLLTGIYQLPFGRGRNFMNSGGVKDAFLGGLGPHDRDAAGNRPVAYTHRQQFGRPVEY